MTYFDRRTVLTAGTLLPILLGAASAPAKPLTVLFVCQAGTAKSAIARELFRKRASERGIAAVAFSRGLHIEDHVSLPLRQKLAAERIETRRDGFSVLTARDVRAADIVIAFTAIPPAHRPRQVLDWSSVASVNDSYVTARADIDARIDALLDSIAADGKRR